MAKLNEIILFLSRELKVRHIPDSSKNGIQIRSKKDVCKIAFAVDACLAVFEKAKKQNCDLIVVHHGLFWKGFKDKSGLQKSRVNFLKKNKISLYACHLPLDLHEQYGNNAELVKMLDLGNVKKFGDYKGLDIGFRGSFEKSRSVESIAKELNRKLNTKCRVITFDKRKIKTVGIISGGGEDGIFEAKQKKLDLFITGELSHTFYAKVRDIKQNMIVAGHYATETVGVKALMPVMEKKFNVKTVFIDKPTGL